VHSAGSAPAFMPPAPLPRCRQMRGKTETLAVEMLLRRLRAAAPATRMRIMTATEATCAASRRRHFTPFARQPTTCPGYRQHILSAQTAMLTTAPFAARAVFACRERRSTTDSDAGIHPAIFIAAAAPVCPCLCQFSPRAAAAMPNAVMSAQQFLSFVAAWFIFASCPGATPRRHGRQRVSERSWRRLSPPAQATRRRAFVKPASRPNAAPPSRCRFEKMPGAALMKKPVSPHAAMPFA